MDQIVALFFNFFKTPPQNSSTVVAPIYTPTNSIKVFLSLHTLANLVILKKKKKKLACLFLAVLELHCSAWAQQFWHMS